MIKVSNLNKSFGEIKALNGINFKVTEGEIFGILGPNGAGKSTTINILSTILKPDSGKVFLDNYELSENIKACKKIIGVVPQEIALYEELSAYDNLLFWGGLYDIDKKELKKNAEHILKALGLYDRRKTKIKTFSGGMKRRINIATALLHSPKILLMDEPTVGIDPQSRNLIFDTVNRLNDNGMTIIYTTHYMEEAEKLCNRIAIIDAGQIIACGNIQELRKISNTKEIISVKLNNRSLNNEFEKLKHIITSKFDISGNLINIYSEDIKNDLPKLIAKLHDKGYKPLQIEIIEANLETIFLKLTGKQLRD